MSAQDNGWGGPGCRADQLVTLPCAGIPLHLRREVAPLFAELIRWLTLARQLTRVPALSSSGGYCKRYISGTTTWSNHSWGLAVDFNAAANPYRHGAPTDMPSGSSAKAASLGMRWGGDYTDKRDPMHFEFMGTPADAARLVGTVRGVVLPSPQGPLVPIPKPLSGDIVWPTVKLGDKTQAVGNLQGLLCAAGRVIPIDYTFGPVTEAALKEWQGAAAVAGGADGICGEQTWRRLLGV